MCDTPEENFMGQLKFFFNNDKSIINDVSEKRIKYLLEEYKNVVVEKSPVAKAEKIIYQPILELRTKAITQTDKRHAAKIPIKTLKETLVQLAKSICNKHGLTYSRFMESKGYGKGFVRIARTEFCIEALNTLTLTQNHLKEFFNVNHATICYYINPYLKKNKK